MRARTPGISFLGAAALAVFALLPRRGEAVTRVNGNFFAEDAVATRPGDDSSLVQTGVNLSVTPQTKKNLKLNVNMRFDYVRSDEQELALANVSPLGNIGLDLGGEAFSFNAQHSRYATMGTATPPTETELSRIALLLVPRYLPHLNASVSRTESATGTSPASKSDAASISTDYRYKWVEMRAGWSADRRESGVQPSNESSYRFVGLGASGEIVPTTILRGQVELDRFEAGSAAGAKTATETRSLRLNADSRPLSFLGFTGNFSRSDVDIRSGTVLPRASNQIAEVGTDLIPHPSLRLGATMGNRRFNDVQTTRSVDFRTVSAAFSREIYERILLGANASRSFLSDPGQGENTADNLTVSTAADLIPRISVRLNTSVGRAENRSFVSARTYNASGTLAERDQLDRDSGGLPPGFVFFDTVHSDLYTKNSANIGDWSLPAHFEPVVGRYSVTRSLDVNATPTDRMSLSLTYATSTSGESLELGRIGSQTLTGSLSYAATRRSNLGLSGAASLPENRAKAISGTGSYSYRLVRGHQMNVSYGFQATAVRRSDMVSASLRLSLRKRVLFELTYSATELFREAQTHFVRARLSHSF